jgi:hypothetical protein
MSTGTLELRHRYRLAERGLTLEEWAQKEVFFVWFKRM